MACLACVWWWWYGCYCRPALKRVAGKVGAGTTHIVVEEVKSNGPKGKGGKGNGGKGDKGRRCKRTLKYFEGVARGCWVVTTDWLVESFQRGYFVEEAPFQVEGGTNDSNGALGGPSRGRVRREMQVSSPTAVSLVNAVWRALPPLLSPHPLPPSRTDF